MHVPVIEERSVCYHCGEACGLHPVVADDKKFCCEGCKMVYGILHKSGLCNYYEITNNPGASQKVAVRANKFAFLDDASIAGPLISFANNQQTHVTFYLPQVHCSSCLWLLENITKINPAIVHSRLNFARKEVEIVFDHRAISLRKVAELLTAIGYEPYISLHDLKGQKPRVNRTKLYKLGVAGFCFANIMLFSFPEYLGIDAREQGMLQGFRMLSLLLSLPVFFYSASEFYSSAWAGIQHRFLNIDAPIVLAIWVTFGRSLYEVLTSIGSGFLTA